jgi:hypothetical protein
LIQSHAHGGIKRRVIIEREPAIWINGGKGGAAVLNAERRIAVDTVQEKIIADIEIALEFRRPGNAALGAKPTSGA